MNYQKQLNELSKLVKLISAKALTKSLINKLNKFSILNGSIQVYFKIIQYLYQLKNILNILVALLESIRGNVIECQGKILKIH